MVFSTKYAHSRGLVVLAAALSPALASAQDGWKVGPGFQVERPGFKLRLAGYVQGESRSFRNFRNDRDELPQLNPQNELRRGRLGLEGELWKRVEFQFLYDFADDFEHVKDAYLELKLAKPAHVRAGISKIPVSAEWLTSAAKTDFIERAMLASELAPGRDYGVSLLGEAGKALSYQVGVFKGDGRKDQSRADTTVAGRLVLTAIKSLDLGLSYSQAEVKADPGGDPLPKGFPGHGPSGFTFSVRRFVDGTRRRVGADAVFTPGPIGLKAEVLRGRQERRGQGSVFDDLPAETSIGWAASATWLLTGEAKKRTIVPRRPIHRGGPGAIELGVRYDALRFDDVGADTGFAGAGNRARNIRRVQDNVLTGGLSWWPVEWIRLMGNVAVEQFDDTLLVPVTGKKGKYVTLMGRVQVAVP